MGRDASIMQEILSAWKSRVVKIWLRYGWDYSSGTSYTIYSCCSQVEKKKRRKGARMIFAETSSRAKRWPVVGARFIAPTGWRGGNSVQKCTHTREEIPSGCGQALSPGAGCYLPGVPESITASNKDLQASIAIL